MNSINEIIALNYDHQIKFCDYEIWPAADQRFKHKFSQNSNSHLKVLSVTRVIRTKFFAEGPQILGPTLNVQPPRRPGDRDLRTLSL